MSRKKIKIDNGTWKKEKDNGCILWRCTDCGKAVVGGPFAWEEEHICPYNFCPYCGMQHIFNICSIFDFEIVGDDFE